MRKIGLVLLGTMLAAMGLSSPAMAASTASVSIPGFLFSPASVTIDYDPGVNSITFTNTHGVFHQPRNDPHGGALEGACLNGPAFSTGSVVVPITWTGQCLASIATTNGGVQTDGDLVIKYHCHIHPGMVGEIVVVGFP